MKKVILFFVAYLFATTFVIGQQNTIAITASEFEKTIDPQDITFDETNDCGDGIIYTKDGNKYDVQKKSTFTEKDIDWPSKIYSKSLDAMYLDRNSFYITNFVSGIFWKDEDLIAKNCIFGALRQDERGVDFVPVELQVINWCQCPRDGCSRDDLGYYTNTSRIYQDITPPTMRIVDHYLTKEALTSPEASTFYVEDFDMGSTDNSHEEVSLSFDEEGYVTTRTFDLDDFIDSDIIYIPIYARDKAGNISVKSAAVKLIGETSFALTSQKDEEVIEGIAMEDTSAPYDCVYYFRLKYNSTTSNGWLEYETNLTGRIQINSIFGNPYGSISIEDDGTGYIYLPNLPLGKYVVTAYSEIGRTKLGEIFEIK